MNMYTVLISYDPADNLDNDVDFAVQKLEEAGLSVKAAEWSIHAGSRLWQQIAHFITSQAESDAWLLYATPRSLGSEACKEEIGYALTRALETRGKSFPIIGIFPGPIDENLIPAAIKSRSSVSLTDSDWVEKVQAAAEGSPTVRKNVIDDYALQVHDFKDGQGRHRKVVEVRPRAGFWAACFMAVLMSEKGCLNPNILSGSRGQVPQVSMTSTAETDGTDGHGNHIFALICYNGASPTQSCFLVCDQLPSLLQFGEWRQDGSGVHYAVGFK